MLDTVIKIEGIGKKYRIGSNVVGRTIGEVFTDASSAPLRWLRGRRGSTSGESDTKEFWALKNVSFDVRRGEVVGIIGRNGAGKSTLLKILSRITEPTRGEVEIEGRVGSLLEVGTGFHPELTGRENVYLNGAIMGMSKSDITRQFDDIVAFSEVEQFIDTPVKRYSSGMYTRLAFAVAAHLEPEILIVDEVLAVGDMAFQKKCLGKMQGVAKDGRTVLFVSHNMGAVRSLCTRCVLLQSGEVEFQGTPNEAIASYLSPSRVANAELDGEVRWNTSGPESPDLKFLSLRLLDANGCPQGTHDAQAPIRVEIDYLVKRRLRGARVNITLITQDGELAFVSTDSLARESDQFPGVYRSVCTIPGRLLNCRMYVVGISCDMPGVRVIVPIQEVISFTVSGMGNQGCYFPEAWSGVVCPELQWQVRQLSDESVVEASGQVL